MSTYDVIGQDAPGSSDTPPTSHIPMSYTQQQLWFAEQIDPDQSLYMEALAMRIRGAIDPALIERCVQEVLRRHEALRTVFPLIDGRPVQRILPPDTPLPFLRLSVAPVPEPEREAALSRQVAGFVEQPLDLTCDLLTRVMFVEMATDDQVLVVTLHHLVCDGLSGRIIFAELGRLYEAFAAGRPAPLAEPGLQYTDFTDWERELHQSGYLDDDIEYWRRRLAGVQATLELPARRRRPGTKGIRGVRAQFPLADAVLHGRLTRFCQEHNVSLYALTLAAYAATISRYTGQRDLVFGTLAANRARSELESIVGQFTNTLPMRLDLTGDPTLLDLIGRTARTSEEAIQHGLVSLGKIIELIAPPRDPSRNALIQHLFLTSGQPASETTWGAATVVPYDIPRNRGRLDTIVEIERRGDELVSWVEYDTGLLDHDEVKQLMHHFANVVAEWLESPGLRLGELTVLDRTEIETYLRPPAAAPVAVARPDVQIRLTDDGAAVARVLAAAVRHCDVRLCDCDAPDGDAGARSSGSGCGCPPRDALELVRIAESLASALWTGRTSRVELSDAVPVQYRFLIRLAGVVRDVATTAGANTVTADPHPQAVVVPTTRLAELLDAAPAAHIIVVGTPERDLVDRLTAAGRPVVVLVEHPDVLGPYATICYGTGEPPAVQLLPHIDAIVLDEHGHVPPVGVPGTLYLRDAPRCNRADAGGGSVTHRHGRPGERLVQTTLTARRTVGGGPRICVERDWDVTAAATTVDTAGSPLHELLADLWCQVLNVDTVELDDDFFELGGHSMLSAGMIERVRESLQVDVPLRTLFTHSRFGEFAEELQTSFPELDDILAAMAGLSDQDVALLLQSISADAPGGPAAAAAKSRRFPLTSTQLQIWMMEYLRGAGITYTIPLEFHISGPLDVDVLRSSIQRIVERHDMLRVTVELTPDGSPVQIVHDTVRLDIPFTDLTGGSQAGVADDIRRRIGFFEFSLQDGPLLATHIVRLAPQEHTLYIVFHHLVMDERSMTLFMSELSAIYAAQLQGTPGPDELKVQIGDYCAWEQTQLSDHRLERLQAFWRARLDGIPELVLPTDFPRPDSLTFKGEFLYRPRERKLFDEVADLAGAHHVTPFIVFTAATALLLHRLSQQDQFIIGMPTDSRGMPGSNELIGCFINVLPVRVDCGGAPTFADFMLRLRDEVVAGYDHRALPLSGIVNALGVARSLDRLPLFQVVTELQVEGWMPFTLPGCRIEFSFINHGTARYDLAFHAMAKRDSFDVCVEVNSTVFTFDTGYRRLDQLTALIRQIVEDPHRVLAAYTIDD
jgi:non-ribosomal peptide synthetase component F